MFVPARKTILGLVLAASLLLGVSSAQAANLLLNPAFEALCPGAACHWSPGSGTALATDIVNPHSESASLAVTRTASTSFYEAVSDCIPVSASTPYNVGYWYRTTTTDLTTLGII